MKKSYIVILILILLVAGFSFFIQDTTSPVSDTNEQTACTMEAKLCPDGSYVGRSGPNCEFAACPEMKNTTEDNTSVNLNVNVAPVKEFTISGKNFSFTPSMITVKKGDRVKITFENSSGFHDFVVDGYGVATKQTQSPTTEVIEFTADKAGSFEYYCSVGTHRSMGMKGTLVVES